MIEQTNSAGQIIIRGTEEHYPFNQMYSINYINGSRKDNAIKIVLKQFYPKIEVNLVEHIYKVVEGGILKVDLSKKMELDDDGIYRHPSTEDLNYSKYFEEIDCRYHS